MQKKSSEQLLLSIFSICFFVLFVQFANAQSDTLNRFDANQQKLGWWKVYLDKHLATTDDMNEAVYFKYSYYQGEFDYYAMSRLGSEQYPVITSTPSTSETINALEGEYKVNFKNGSPKFILRASNGKLVEYKEFYKNGNLKHSLNYTEMCGDTPLEYCIYMYSKNGTLKMKTTLKKPGKK